PYPRAPNARSLCRPSGGGPRSLLADQPNHEAIVVEIAPIRFPVVRDVFRRYLRGVPGAGPEPGFLYCPLIYGLAPLEALEGRGRISDKLSVAHVPIFLERLAQHRDPVWRTVGLAEGEQRIDRVGDEAPAYHQVVVGTLAHTQQLRLARRVVEQIDRS